MERRGIHPESWVWETEDGRRWLTRLVVATLYLFGGKRGVGIDTMSAFFARLRLETQLGCSPSALRGVMQALEAARREMAGTWEPQGCADGEGRESIGAVDEPFFAPMILVFMDLKTGDLLQEEVAEDRTYLTWQALVEERLQALRTPVLSVVSDRAKALMQRAEQGRECLSMPAFFPCMHAIVKSSSLALGRRVRHAHKARREAQEALARLQGRPQAPHEPPDATAVVAMRHAEVTHWEEARRTYHTHWETLSLTLHPFRLVDSAPHTSAQVAIHLQATREAIEVCAQSHQLPARPHALLKVRQQVPALAALVDCWWQGLQQALAPCLLSPRWRQWVHAGLLPMVSWDRQVARTRCRRRRAKMQAACAPVRAAFTQPPLTQRLAPAILAEWHAWATDRGHALQRASSAVAGRHGYLSHMHHNHRGLPTRRYKVWTVLHNCDCRAADGTTPAARFFRRTFPDLFETVLSHIEALPQPRRRKHEVALKH
jgi:hypothetical protein